MPSTVTGFVRSLPNDTLVHFATLERRRALGTRGLDLGCGAGRHTFPLAAQGWNMVGLDLSLAMLEAAQTRVHTDSASNRPSFALAPMDALPVASRSFDLIVAHGIWNLARSAAEFRRATAEAARVAAPSAALFVFTFSRHMLPAAAIPVEHEPFTFTQFSGNPQCFLTRQQLIDEMAAVAFTLDDTIPFVEHNRPPGGATQIVSTPVILEAAFRFTGG